MGLRDFKLGNYWWIAFQGLFTSGCPTDCRHGIFRGVAIGNWEQGGEYCITIVSCRLWLYEWYGVLSMPSMAGRTFINAAHDGSKTTTRGTTGGIRRWKLVWDIY